MIGFYPISVILCEHKPHWVLRGAISFNTARNNANCLDVNTMSTIPCVDWETRQTIDRKKRIPTFPIIPHAHCAVVLGAGHYDSTTCSTSVKKWCSSAQDGCQEPTMRLTD